MYAYRHVRRAMKNRAEGTNLPRPHVFKKYNVFGVNENIENFHKEMPHTP